MASPFLPTAQPKTALAPPSGKDWLHEIKFDGWRVQLHGSGAGVRLYSRNGIDLTARFKSLARELACVAARDCIIDGELVALDADGRCNFEALHRRKRGAVLGIWAFDLLHLNGADFRHQPLIARRVRLQRLVAQSQITSLRYSETFDDPLRLLKAAEEMGLEGIVSKRKAAPYIATERSGGSR